MVVTAMDAPVTVQMSLQPLNIVQCAADIIWSRVPTEFPDLRLALSEGGIGWVPYFLEKADFVYDHHRAWTHEDFGAIRPSDAFRRSVLTCFIDDVVGLKNREMIGPTTIAWECDFPHSDSTWPRGPETAMAGFVAAGLNDDEIDLFTWKNASQWYGFDPFEHRKREECTVGALRASALDVDTTPHEYGAQRMTSKAVADGAGSFIESVSVPTSAAV
jgi:hypothetical protein